MVKEKTNYAGTKHYVLVRAFLESKGVDVNNAHNYAKVLEEKGFTVNTYDINQWINSQKVEIDSSGLDLDA